MELDYCVWAVSTSQLKENDRERERGREGRDGGVSGTRRVGGGGLQESWHFQTIISVEPFRGFNVIFGLWIFALFSFEQKATESDWGGKERGNM